MKYVRILGIITVVLYGSYYVYYEGWFMVLGYLILLIIGIWQVYKTDIRSTNIIKREGEQYEFKGKNRKIYSFQ